MSEKRDVIRSLQGTTTGRAIIFFGFATALSFLVVVYGFLKEQEYARHNHRVKEAAVLSLKSAYQDYESTLLMHVADPVHIPLSDAQKRFNFLELRLSEAEEVTGIKDLMPVRAALKDINPTNFQAHQPQTPISPELRAVLVNMTSIQNNLLSVETALADKSAGFDAAWSMQTVAELLMGLSSVALLLLIGRLLMNQSDVLKLLRVQKDTVDKQAAIQLSAIEASRDGLVILDNDGCIVFMNRAFSLLHYLSSLGRKEFIGRFWADLYNAEGRDFINKN